MHILGCRVLESILISKGFRIYNISPVVPANDIIFFIRGRNPTMILISVSLLDNVGSAIRLVKKLRDHIDLPIMIGDKQSIKLINLIELN